MQPRANVAHLTAIEPSQSRKPAAVAQKSAAAPTVHHAANDKLKISLDAFAKDCINRMNKQRRPGLSQKEVLRQSDGSYIARYLAVDPDSLETSYNPTEGHRTIKYVGRMNYHEVEYVCIGKNQKQALAGPFSETNRTPIIELIKYKNNKWTY